MCPRCLPPAPCGVTMESDTLLLLPLVLLVLFVCWNTYEYDHTIVVVVVVVALCGRVGAHGRTLPVTTGKQNKRGATRALAAAAFIVCPCSTGLVTLLCSLALLFVACFVVEPYST